MAADAELRRRHPDQRFTPLRSAEPPSATPAQRGELTLTAGQPIPEMGQWVKGLAAGHRAFAQTLAERQSLMVPSEDPGYGDLGQAFPPWPGPATSGTWTGLACPGHGLALGTDVDNATLQRLAAGSEIADLTWEAPGELAAGHAQVFQDAMRAHTPATPSAPAGSGRSSRRSGRGPGQRTTRCSSSCRARA